MQQLVKYFLFIFLFLISARSFANIQLPQPSPNKAGGNTETIYVLLSGKKTAKNTSVKPQPKTNPALQRALKNILSSGDFEFPKDHKFLPGSEFVPLQKSSNNCPPKQDKADPQPVKTK